MDLPIGPVRLLCRSRSAGCAPAGCLCAVAIDMGFDVLASQFIWRLNHAQSYTEIMCQTLFVLVFLSMLAACSVTPSTPAPATAPTARSTEASCGYACRHGDGTDAGSCHGPDCESTEAPTVMPTATPVALEPTVAPTADSSASGTTMADEHDQVAAPFNVSVAQYFTGLSRVSRHGRDVE